MKKPVAVLAVLVALALLAAGIGYYVLVHTSVPLKTFAELLADDDDLAIEDVSGSMSSGIRIKRLHFRSPEGHLQEFEDIGFSYAGLWRVVRHRELVVNEVSIGHARVTFAETTRDRSERDPAPSAEPRPDAAPPAERNETSGDGGLRRFEVQRVRLANLTLLFPGMAEPVRVDALELDDMLVTDGRFRVGGIRVAGNALELTDVEPLNPHPDATFAMRLEGRALPPLHPGVTRPLPLAVEWSIAGADEGRFELLAFDDSRLQWRIAPGTGGHGQQLRMIDLTAADWLATTSHWPVTRLDVEWTQANAPGDGAEPSPWRHGAGSFKVLGRRFEVAPGTIDPPAPGFDGDDATWQPVLAGQRQVGDRRMLCELWWDPDNQRAWLHWRLANGAAADPAPAPRDLVAWLWRDDTDAGWQALDAADRDRLEPLLEPWPLFKPVTAAPDPPATAAPPVDPPSPG